MRTRVMMVTAAALVISGCGPQDHSVEFYTKPENAAEFAKALEACKKSGLSLKDKCNTVWQAKMEFDRAEEAAQIKQAVAERNGTTIVPQSSKKEAVAATPSRTGPNSATAAAVSPAAKN